jgi:CRP-like cAMP-binding protein
MTAHHPRTLPPMKHAYGVPPASAWGLKDPARRGAPVVNFWSSLDLSQQRAFRAFAEERTFARGARLMREGGHADFVMLILDGWTQITVQDGGDERVVAERGPGQLVGERAALQVNVRSATVVVLELVHALVMSTEDFASFLSEHRAVLDLVESQIYDRLTEDEARHQSDRRPAALLWEPLGRQAVQRQREQPLAGENCTVLRTDVVGFGALNRNDRDRLIVRQGSLEVVQASLGPLWESCMPEDRGDGLLIVVPPEVPTGRIVERLHRELPGELVLHNRTYSEQAHIHLRVAVDVGPVVRDPIGLSGGSLIRTARLIDAPAFKEAMASTDAVLGIIVSAFVYETAIRQPDGWMGPGEYTPVEVNVKESSISAWMRLADPMRDRD